MKDRIFNIFDKIQEYSVYAIIFFIPIAPAPLEIFGIIGVVSFFIRKILKPDLIFLKRFANIFLLLFILFVTLSLFNSGIYFVKGIMALVCKWIEYILICFIVQDSLNTRNRITIALSIFLTLTFFVGLDAITQRYLNLEFFRGREMLNTGTGLKAVRAAFNHFNDFGSYLIFPLSLTICMLVLGKLRKLLKWILLIILLLSLNALILTFSRGAWLGFICSLVLMLVISRKIKVLSFVLLGFILIISFLPIVKERAGYTFQANGDSGRFGMWQAAWLMIKDHPFIGRGLGTFMDYSTKYIPTSNPVYAHNCYLQIWAETGIFSLISFLLFVSAILLKGIKLFKRDKNPLILGLVCAIFGFLVHSSFDTQFYSLQMSFLFWSMLGLLGASL